MLRIIAAMIAASIASAGALAACPPPGASREQLAELRTAQWKMPDAGARQALAIGLADCLSDPDPVLRDNFAFSTLMVWMRGDQLDTPTIHVLRTTLLARMEAPDAGGFAQPFAALVLAEVARIDRLKPFLSAAERSELVRAASRYLAGVRDYRGFDGREGWRHGVAHGADLMMQLALNPAIAKPEHDIMLAAIGSQVVAANAHFYHYGEGERLMAPVLYLAQRATLNEAEWEAWFARLTAAPAPGAPGASDAQAPLARRHNLRGFLLPLYAALSESKDEAVRARLLPIVTRALNPRN